MQLLRLDLKSAVASANVSWNTDLGAQRHAVRKERGHVERPPWRRTEGNMPVECPDLIQHHLLMHEAIFDLVHLCCPHQHRMKQRNHLIKSQNCETSSVVVLCNSALL